MAKSCFLLLQENSIIEVYENMTLLLLDVLPHSTFTWSFDGSNYWFEVVVIKAWGYFVNDGPS